MSVQGEVRKLIGKLGDQVAAKEDKDWAHVLTEQVDITPYRVKGNYPGEAYVLLGHSFNADYRIIGTQMESRRAGLLGILFEHKGNRKHCVTVQEAFAFEGFVTVLSLAERETLAKLPPESLIGPAYDKYSKCLRTAFAVWRPMVAKQEPPALLVGVASHSRG